ncbi:MAG TPA: biotin-dependent carboxyltransferase family protein [Candidatus Binatia bacterium]|nr:biotin-dependent carboxyltransferase family protein [Candidatus Binatia bacterium]
MSVEVCEVQATGIRMSVQDEGRRGWARHGVPASGAMDDRAAVWANRLLNNPISAPVIELLGSGARLKFLRDTWVAVTGANTASIVPLWRATQIHKSEVITFSELRAGLWTYLAVEGGIASPTFLNSASVYERGNIGRALQRGDIVRRNVTAEFALPSGVSSRVAPWTEQRDYLKPPKLCVWPGPQWDLFSDAQRATLFGQDWTVTTQSDRVGYRLSGEPLQHNIGELLSEPVLVGTIQVPANGQPIVTMRDGPTIGGYPKLGVLEPDDISWLAQVQPGRKVRFQLIDAI